MHVGKRCGALEPKPRGSIVPPVSPGARLAESSRERSWEELGERRFDVLVIGGGIVGAGIAYEASRAGLAVALVDRGDFAAETTSASTKMVHGGIRYLRLGDVRLVRHAHAQRRALMGTVAPHLVRPLPFVLPIYPDGPYGRLAVAAGVWAYSALSLEQPRALVTAREARRLVPDLRMDGLRTCGIYEDSWTHDSRFCLLNVRAAAEAGATVLNYAEAVELRITHGRIEGAEVADRLGDASASVNARVVVNATGPWIDAVRRLEDPNAEPSCRLSKGVHLTLPLPSEWSAALTIPQSDVRVSFAVPWLGMLVVGTTDTKYEDDPSALAVTEDEISAILDEGRAAVDPEIVRRDRVLAAFAGLRVLPGGDASTAKAKRDAVLVRGRAGMLSVGGGKLTTYREIARGALEALRSDLALHRLETAPAPLPGALDVSAATQRIARLNPDLDPETRLHLAHLYGGRATDVLALAADEPELLARVHPDARDIRAQVPYARRFEWACRPEDVLRRRTTLELRGCATPDVVAQVDELMGAAAHAPA